MHQQLVVAAETSDKETCDHEIVMATLRGQVQREVQALKKDLEASQAAERQATEQGEALRRELERSKQELKIGKVTADKARAGEEALAALKGQVEVEVRALHQQVEELENQVFRQAATMESLRAVKQNGEA